MGRLRGILLGVLLALLSVVAFLLLVEGAFSSYVAVRGLLPDSRAAESHHTRYDELLGWSNVPDVFLPDFYGPGRDLSINGQGFRNLQEFPARTPPGVTRLLCVGDSFTLGYGVGDEQTWCHRLSVHIPGIETINMGQGGYGLGQFFLHYRRDAADLEHQVVVLALISDDLNRMLQDEQYGYYKPRLELRDGVLEVETFPVPRPGLLSALRRSRTKLLGFRTFETLWGTKRSTRSSEAADAGPHLTRVLMALTDELAALVEARGARLVVVHLPVWQEYEPGPHDQVRVQLAGLFAPRGVPYIDLLEELRLLSAEEYSALFIRKRDHAIQRFGRGAGGHYNRRGNTLVAKTLRSRLRSLWLGEGRTPGQASAPTP